MPSVFDKHLQPVAMKSELVEQEASSEFEDSLALEEWMVQSYDQDGDGALDVKEIVQIMTEAYSYGIDIAENEDATEWFAKVDVNGNGRLDRNELVYIM